MSRQIPKEELEDEIIEKKFEYKLEGGLAGSADNLIEQFQS